MEPELDELMGKLNSAKFKNPEQIRERVDKLLRKYHVVDFYHIANNPVQQSDTRKIGKGHPGKQTRYTTTLSTI